MQYDQTVHCDCNFYEKNLIKLPFFIQDIPYIAYGVRVEHLQCSDNTTVVRYDSKTDSLPPRVILSFRILSSNPVESKKK
jgi:hypothetical protein